MSSGRIPLARSSKSRARDALRPAKKVAKSRANVVAEFGAMSRSLAQLHALARELRTHAETAHVAIVFGYRIDDLAAHAIRTHEWYIANIGDE